MPMMQTTGQIPEPIDFVGRNTGMVHGTAGDNPNGPEEVSIKPTMPGPTGDPPGGPSYASGGSFLVGGYPAPQDPTGGNSYTSTIGTGIFGAGWNPQQSGGGIQPPAVDPNVHPPSIPQTRAPQIPGAYQYPATPPAGPNAYGNPNAQTWQAQQQQQQAQQRQIDARNELLDYRARVLDAKGATQPAQDAYRSAKERTRGAEGVQNQMQRDYYGQQGQDEQQRLAELTAIRTAHGNLPDILNTAEAQNAYSSENRRDAAMGVAPPAEVQLPYDANPARMAGVRPKIMTQEQRLADNASYDDPVRAAKLALAQNAVSLQGTDVRAASLAAEQAGMTLEQANQMVEQAQQLADYSSIAAERTGLGVQQANQDLAAAGRPPFPGAVEYVDPETGASQWVTPEEKGNRDFEDSQRRTDERRPAMYDQQQQQKQYEQEQRRAVEGPIADLSDAAVLNLIGTPSTLVNPGGQPRLATSEEVRALLVRRFMSPPHNLTLQAASELAASMVAIEMQQRANARGRPTPGASSSGAAASPTIAPATQQPQGQTDIP